MVRRQKEVFKETPVTGSDLAEVAMNLAFCSYWQLF
jgi:hypothetical protein